MIRKLTLAIVAIIAILTALGLYSRYFVAQPTMADQAMHLPVDAVRLVVQTNSGEHSFTIEIADDQNERSRGLMFREAMDDDHGMLFIFPETREVGFWMRNTPMPLDLIFVGQDGRVRDILPGEPFSDAVIAPGEPVRFVLELKRGSVAKANIEIGDLVRHPVINGVASPVNPG